jgi:chromosomal replication initiator protein
LELSTHVDAAAAWGELRTELRRVLGESMYLVWIEPLQLESLDSQVLRLRAPGETGAWLRKRYGRLLERCARTVIAPELEIAFVDQGERSRARAVAPARPSFSPDPGPAALNPRYTFDQYIIGQSNRLAHAAALAVAEHPGQAYNPLFLYAPPGLGKTHLLHAIGNYAVTFGGGARVCLTTAEAFTNHFISSLGNRSLHSFKQAYREADLLLVDDVQFLASKVKTEEEFFHTFNALYERGRQLVLTCDRLPSQLQGIAQRLRERFEAGLVADIAPPDQPARVAILRKRAALDCVPLAEEGVLELIAARVTENIRALEGALIRVVAFHSLTGQPIDLALTEHVLDQMRLPPAAQAAPAATAVQVSMTTVQSAVAAAYGLTVEELISPARTGRIAWPRQIAISLARELTGASLAAIGAAFGGRNHATVLHACKRVAQRMSEDPQAVVEIDELARALRRDVGDRPR